ncbi:TVP38/TMEM64 family protein [Halodesulfurarchaeum sp. HSR-GB]|uniref:TVP38/TMEM64 family protein n=1 Tax=Halodesulfurarchaeum sp. HSR-GB TaxID=3074077 RepID=UPI00285709FD|nr:TVP38/TMEM64 family protein [Halodesulfurarchaeum sp. HSR-GB]MDR5655940.1 TVP38/TMEM64 family protein [Halodesulfurarchaeum sp. HSR-GB]
MSDRGPVLPPIFVSPRARWIAILSILVLLVLAGVGLVLFDYSFGSMLDAQAVREAVESFGLLAPLVFILIQATQVVVAPIPGQVLALAGGYAFGPVLGTIYSLIGATIGSAIAFGLSRRFGRPAVERLVHPLTLEMVDGFLEDHGRLAVFLVFLVPGLPDDALCFVCGLTPLPLSHLVVLSTLGRIPGYAMLSLAGGRLATNRPLEAALIIALIAVLAALAYYQRERLLEFSR